MGAGASAGAASPLPEDPWAGKSGAECLELVKGEEGEPVVVEDGADGLGTALAAAPDAGALFVVAENCELSNDRLASFIASLGGDGAVVSTDVMARVTVLNISGNALRSLEALDSAEAATSIRSLVTSSNANLTGPPPSLLSCPFLVDLDLSYNGELFASFLASTSGGGGGGGGGGEEEGEAAAASPSPFAHLGGTLLRLNLTSCGLPHLGGGDTGAPLVLDGLSQLATLGVAENELSDLSGTTAGLAPLASSLEELDLQENPLCEEPSESAYREYCASRLGGGVVVAFPKLRSIDGKSLVMEGKIRGIGEVIDDGKGAGMIGDAPAMAALETEVNAAMAGHVDTTVVA